jgi:hypothetical protein
MEAQQGLSVDHVFVAVSRGGPEVEPLLDAGFAEGPPNVHRGQGTACRRFFFENVYLEFAWLEDPAEATSPLVRPTGLDLRLGGGPGSSRIGICVRLSSEMNDPPVSTWAYRPPYLPQGYSIPVAANSANPREPLLFFLPAALARAPAIEPHPNGTRAVSHVALTLPKWGTVSPELDWLVNGGLMSFDVGDAESLQVEFDGRARGQSLRLDTATPLVMSW